MQIDKCLDHTRRIEPRHAVLKHASVNNAAIVVVITGAKMFYQTQTTRRPPKSPPPATEWSRLLLQDVICSDRVPFRRFRGVMEVHSAFLSLVTLTFDL